MATALIIFPATRTAAESPGAMTSSLPASPTGGVQPMSIEGRCKNVRERLIKMSAEDRKWRAQWLKDQHLSPNEPRSVQGFGSQSAKYTTYCHSEESRRQ